MRTRISLRAAAAVVTAVLMALAATGPASAAAEPVPPKIQASAGILIDSADGKVLWEKQPRSRKAIASLTKVLTALVTIRQARPSDKIAASVRAEAVGSDDPLVTELELTAGEELTVEQLLYGMLLPSANDAAVALAEGISGSTAKFAVLMNQTARRLGARNSNFVNPSGFDDPRHYSTAADMALITRAAMNDPTFRKMVSTVSYTIGRNGRPPLTITNRNLLLGSFQGANGVKTGQTKASGKSLIASARRSGEERIAIVLSSPDPAAESSRLLDYGFNSFRRFEVARSGVPWGVLTYGNGATAQVVARSDLSLLLKASAEAPRVTYRPTERHLYVAEGGGRTVPVTVKCSRPSCHVGSGGAAPLAWLMTLFSPLMGIFR